MARANALSKIEEDFLTCCICFEKFSDPKQLDCLHSFCLHCLVGYVEKNGHFRQAPKCPVCRAPFRLPKDGARGLRDNFFVAGICETMNAYSRSIDKSVKISCSGCDEVLHNQSASYCLQCGGFLCENCLRHHQRMKATKEHQFIGQRELKDVKSWATSRPHLISVCKNHREEMVKLYCKECEVPACVLCSLQDHRGHDVIDIAVAGEESRNDVDALLTTAQTDVSKIQFLIDGARRVKQSLAENKEKTLTEIEERADQLIKSLTKEVRDQADKLKRETNQRYTRKDAAVTDHEKKLEADLRRASDACDYSEKVVTYGNNVEVVTMKSKLVFKLRSVCDQRLEGLTITGGIQLSDAESKPRVQSIDIGRVVWKRGGPELARKVKVGDRVERSADWTWDDQDGGLDCKGTVVSEVEEGLWIKVKWDHNGKENTYRLGYGGYYDLELADEK
ncbi:E3 ubiquitin-protein ligase TRIM56-like [Ptychodera flava]|uniref:E3 ubiquitin-protein ligase TRIM56-like n=1 Tax=Ptychodera flava TaxID=63121 RepID=UPI003969D809